MPVRKLRKNPLSQYNVITEEGGDSIPWSTFEGFNLNLQKGYDYMLPIFTMGRFYQDSEKIMLPFAIQVHHAICDGFHICRFINELQELISG